MPSPLHRLRANIPWKPLATTLAVVLLILLLWKLPQYQIAHTPGITGEKRFDSENEARKTLAQLLAGAAVLLGLYFTARTFGLSREGHLTDRFTKAIEQLGKSDGTNPNIEVRLGAIYALERIAIDSPRDHWTIMEVLTAYVRQNAPLDLSVPYVYTEKPRTDIQAILTVLGRRQTGKNRERPGQFLDLSLSRLCGASMNRANLKGVRFSFCQLEGAFLSGANLQRANFWDAKLHKANLSDTNLRNASLFMTNFEGARLERADLQGVDLLATRFHEAFLADANLRDVKNAKPNVIQAAKNWERAHYSPAFRAELGLPPEQNSPPSTPAQ